MLVYHAAIEQMKLNESTTLLIDFTHILAYSEALAQTIQNEYYRSVSMGSVCTIGSTRNAMSYIYDNCQIG